MTNIPEIAGGIALLIVAVGAAAAMLLSVWGRLQREKRQEQIKALQQSTICEIGANLDDLKPWFPDEHNIATPREVADMLAKHFWHHCELPSGVQVRAVLLQKAGA